MRAINQRLENVVARISPVKIMLLGIVASILDIFATYICLVHLAGREISPLHRWVIESNGWAGMVILRIAILSVIFALCLFEKTRRWAGLAMIIYLGFAILYMLYNGSGYFYVQYRITHP